MSYKKQELLLNSTFHNKCRYCNICCHSEKIIITSPLDLYLIHKSNKEFPFENLFTITTNHNTKFPLLTLKKVHGRCLYITKEGTCALGELKPYQCSILPIAKKLIMPKDEFVYYYSSLQSCSNKKKISSIEVVDGFLNNKNHLYEVISDNWHRAYYKLINLSGGFNKLHIKLHDAIFQTLQDILISVLYRSIFNIKSTSLEEISKILDEKYKIAELAILEAEKIQLYINNLAKLNKPLWLRKNNTKLEDFNFITSRLQNILTHYKEKYSKDTLTDVNLYEIPYEFSSEENFIFKFLKLFIC